MMVCTFTSADDILAATRDARDRGLAVHDAYTPYAVHGMDDALKLRRSRLPLVCLMFGLTGAAAKFWFQIWTSATSWAVNVGGKPFRSVPAFVPVTFEIMVLFAGIGTVLVFLWRAGLRPGRKPPVRIAGVTDDRFALAIIERDAAFDARAERSRMIERFHAERVEEQDW
jgi:hypothetical protein